MKDPITQVQELYERHPYPHYPLLGKPRWQDGYLCSSLFAQAQFGRGAYDPRDPAHFLSIGSGEILPYIIRQWEPSATKVICVDLSRRSLNRARFRTALLGRRITYEQADINLFLQSAHQAEPQGYQHMEAFGVLHHIPTFRTTLAHMSAHLAPHGLIRVMVYNRTSRDWIWQINRAFVQLGLKFQDDAHVKIARDILYGLARLSPLLAERLRQIGRTALDHDTRFADTFLHPWESRATLQGWFEAFNAAGLKPVGLFDRYAELDDLPNPLWRCPSVQELSERALDYRYESNLEVWLARDRDLPGDIDRHVDQKVHPVAIPLRLKMRMPPSQLNRYDETRSLSFGTKLLLWQGFVKALHHHQKDIPYLGLLQRLDLRILQRLARLGLLLPSTAIELKRWDQIIKPLHPSMDPPKYPPKRTQDLTQEVTFIVDGLHVSPCHKRQAIRRLLRIL